MKTVTFVFLIIPSCFMAVICGIAYAEDTSKATHLFRVGTSFAVYTPEAQSLSIGTWNQIATAPSQKLTVKGQVFGIVETPVGFLVATGMGRGDLQAPVRVTSYDRQGKEQGIVFEKASERSQVSFFREHKGRLWITFFESKFITKTGYLTKVANAPWQFTEVASERLGDAVELIDDAVLIGRPYGDIQGEDGDLSLIKNGTKTLLPSYRGVRSIAVLNGKDSSKIVIGDGWHQNYGQFAQARISTLSLDSATKRYALEIIARDTAQYNFNKLIPFSLGGKEFVAALGNRSLSVFGLGVDGSKQELYARKSEDSYFDVVQDEMSDTSVAFVVLDNGLHRVRFTPNNGKGKD